jgi:hypothetical protein
MYSCFKKTCENSDIFAEIVKFVLLNAVGKQFRGMSHCKRHYSRSRVIFYDFSVILYVSKVIICDS